MTNTEMWLDEIISHIKSIKSDIWMLHEIMSLPNCNDCKNKDCEYKPKWGEHIRYNCPLHNADRKTEPQTNADQHVQRVEYVENVKRCRKCKHIESEHQTPIASDGKRYTYVVCTAKECNYEPKTEPQTDCSWK